MRSRTDTTKPPTTAPAVQNPTPTEDTSMPDADMDTDTLTQAPNKRKRKNTDPSNSPKKESHILSQSTFRNLPWTYFHILLVTPSAVTSSSTSTTTKERQDDEEEEDINPMFASPLLTSALRSYLGITGTAIPIDILKTQGRNVWIRVPRQDARGVRAALSNWVGSAEGEDVFGRERMGRVSVAWRVVGASGVLGCGVSGGGDGREMFG